MTKKTKANNRIAAHSKPVWERTMVFVRLPVPLTTPPRPRAETEPIAVADPPS
jgi:hypothetical protein